MPLLAPRVSAGTASPTTAPAFGQLPARSLGPQPLPQPLPPPVLARPLHPSFCALSRVQHCSALQGAALHFPAPEMEQHSVTRTDSHTVCHKMHTHGRNRTHTYDTSPQAAVGSRQATHESATTSFYEPNHCPVGHARPSPHTHCWHCCWVCTEWQTDHQRQNFRPRQPVRPQPRCD